jgi:hypothetical protein
MWIKGRVPSVSEGKESKVHWKRESTWRSAWCLREGGSGICHPGSSIPNSIWDAPTEAPTSTRSSCILCIRPCWKAVFALFQTTLESDSAPQKKMCWVFAGRTAQRNDGSLQAIRGPSSSSWQQCKPDPSWQSDWPGTEGLQDGLWSLSCWYVWEVNIALKENFILYGSWPNERGATGGFGRKAMTLLWYGGNWVPFKRPCFKRASLYSSNQHLKIDHRETSAGDIKRSTVSAKEDDLLSTTDDINSAAT